MGIRIGEDQSYSFGCRHKRNVNRKTSGDSFSSMLNNNIKRDSVKISSAALGSLESSNYTPKNVMTDDEKESLIEDKYIYDSQKLKDRGIEFGSQEWKDWKKTEGTACIPSLDSPWQVRRAWRDVLSECKTPREREEVNSLKSWMFLDENTNEKGYCDMDTKSRTTDYLKFAIGQKQRYMDISKSDLGHSYSIFLSTLDKLIEKLSK